MKRLIAALAAVFLISAPAFALTDEEYSQLKNFFPGFAAAEEKLTRAFNEAEKVMDKSEFEALKEAQSKWIAEQRDVSANKFVQDDWYMVADAYTRVTLDRAESIFARIRAIQNVAVDNVERINDIAGDYAVRESELYMRLSLISRAELLFEVSFSGRGTAMVMYGNYKPGDNTMTFSNDNNEYGEQAVLTFQDNDTISVKVNDAFKDNSFDPEGIYKRKRGE